MTRSQLVPVLALSLFALACTPDATPGPDSERAGGAGGAGKGGAGGGSGGRGGSAGVAAGGSAGGSTGTGGMSGGGGTASGGAGGAAGGGATAGSGGSGSGGAGGSATADAPAEGGTGAEAGPVPADQTLPNKPWIRLCPKASSQADCCELLCQCLAKTCADSPRDNPAHDACIGSCTKLGNMQMRCRIYHCYESLNPNVPKDHVSHCGHASGRVGGGGCPTAVYN